MRHVGSSLLSLPLVVVIYLLGGAAQGEVARATATVGGTDREVLAVGVAMLAAASALYGILLLARLSPIGPVAAGLALAGVSAIGLLDPDRLASWVPDDVAGYDGAATAWAGAVGILLAVPLLLTAFVPSRWRSRWAATAMDAAGASDPSTGVRIPGWSDDPPTTPLRRVNPDPALHPRL